MNPTKNNSSQKDGVTLNEKFHHISKDIGEKVGSPYAFILALLIVMTWLITGPLFDFSDTWQLVINTGTTIVTFLMVFLIQNMQNRDAKAVHLKLDELIRAVRPARNQLVDLEDLSDAELEALQAQFKIIRDKAKNSPRENNTQ
jgi:low affinity Fe/Cu permease